MRKGKIRNGESIEQTDPGLHPESPDRPDHPEMSGLENVLFIDFRHLDQADRPAEPLDLLQFLKERLATGLAELFGVIDQRMRKSGWENHRPHGNRTSQGATARFVHPNHKPERSVFLFQFQIGHDHAEITSSPPPVTRSLPSLGIFQLVNARFALTLCSISFHH